MGNSHTHNLLTPQNQKKKKNQKLKGSHLQTNVDSQIAAMVYFDLIIRSVTEPGLLSIMIKFLLDCEKFDEQRIIDVLIDRINSPDSRVRILMINIGLMSKQEIFFIPAMHGIFGVVRYSSEFT